MSDSNSERDYNNNNSNVPKFPIHNRSEYASWKKRMELYLRMRGLYTYIDEKATTTKAEIKSTSSSSDSSTSSSSSSSTPSTSPNNERDRAAVCYILISSLSLNQQIMLQNIDDCMEMWKKLNSIYGVHNSIDNKMSLFDKLKNITKQKNEQMEHYISRIDKLIYELKSLGVTTDNDQRKWYIYDGLHKLDEYRGCIEAMKMSNINK